MPESIRDAYEKLISSEEFENKGFLCDFFLTCELQDIDKTPWQVDFYNEDDDTITSYVVGKKVNVTDGSKVFKKEDSKVERLELSNVKINFDKVLKKCDLTLKNHDEKSVKVIVVLQNLSFPVWNITHVTQKFNMVNIKIDASSGEVKDESVISLLSFGKLDEGDKKVIKTL